MIFEVSWFFTNFGVILFFTIFNFSTLSVCRFSTSICSHWSSMIDLKWVFCSAGFASIISSSFKENMPCRIQSRWGRSGPRRAAFRSSWRSALHQVQSSRGSFLFQKSGLLDVVNINARCLLKLCKLFIFGPLLNSRSRHLQLRWWLWLRRSCWLYKKHMVLYQLVCTQARAPSSHFCLGLPTPFKS